MKNKILLPLLVVLGAALLWMVKMGGTGDPLAPNLESTATTEPAGRERAAVLPNLGAESSTEVREEVPRELASQPLEPGDDREVYAREKQELIYEGFRQAEKQLGGLADISLQTRDYIDQRIEGFIDEGKPAAENEAEGVADA